MRLSLGNFVLVSILVLSVLLSLFLSLSSTLGYLFSNSKASVLSESNLWLSIFGLTGILVLLIYNLNHKFKTYFLVRDLPTCPIKIASVGINEFKGKVGKDSELLISTFTKTPCVYYHYVKEQYVSRGKHSGWETVEEKIESKIFYLRDDTGRIKVDLTDGDVDSLFTAKVQEGNYRYFESVIKEGDYIQLLGNVTQLEINSVEPELIVRNESFLYASTQVDERKILGKLLLISLGLSVLVLILLTLIQAILFKYYAIFEGYFLISAILSLLLYSLVMTIVCVNIIKIAKISISKALSDLETLLTQRLTAIEPIIIIARKYVKFEENLQGSLRSNPTSKTAEMIIEKYPELKSNELIKDVIKKLSDLEEDIADEKQLIEYYNLNYENITKTFPGLLLVKLA